MALCGYVRRALSTLSAALILVGALEGQSPSAVQIIRLTNQAIFPDAIEDDALAFACADDPGVLAGFFAEKRLPYDAALVRPWEGRKACHVYYEPTLKGFRASRDNAPIQGLYVAIQPTNFFARSTMPGYNLEIAKTVLGRLPREAQVRVGVAGHFDKEFWAPAAESHFGGLPHEFSFFATDSDDMQPWAQDHMKAGQLNGQPRTLTPRRLFEGDPEQGEQTRGLLTRLAQNGFVRSKLSWEGGGIQFVANPKNPSQTIIAVGLRRYWGPELTEAEYGYVLRVEFGADIVLNLNQTGAHADYVTAFFPQDDTVLVSTIVRNNPDLARAAAFHLLDSFGDKKPPEIRRLASLLAEWDGPLADRPAPLVNAISAAGTALNRPPPENDPKLDVLVGAYVARNCPGNPGECFAAQNEMLRQDPELLRRAATHLVGLQERAELRQVLLGVISDQLSPTMPKEQAALDQAAKQLEAWGFRTVRVPHLTSGGELRISYINGLLFDRRYFMPSLGLGRFEERLVANLRDDLGGRYEIIPVDAHRVLAMNGGLHCVFGITREIEK